MAETIASVRKKPDIALALILCAAVFLLGFMGLDNNCDWGDDFAAYMIDGIALAEGRYEEQIAINVILRSGSLVGKEEAHVHAFGFPLLHALTYRLAGFDTQSFSQLWLYKLPSLLAISMMAGAYYLFLRKRFGLGLSFLLSLALCAHTELYHAVRNLYNDAFFMSLSLCCFFLVEIYLDKDHKSRRILWGLLLGLMLWYSYSVRLNGIVTAVAVLLAQFVWLIRKKKKPGFTELVPVGTFLVLYVIFNVLIFPKPTSTSGAGDMNLANFISGSKYYMGMLIEWARHFAAICLDVPVSLAATFFYSVFDSPQLCAAVSRTESFIRNEVYTVLAICFLLLALWGMLRIGLKRDVHIVFFIFVSFIGTAALNLGQELRYLYVLLPHLLMYAVQAVMDLLSLSGANKKRPGWVLRLGRYILTGLLCIFAILPAAESGFENITNDVQENLTAYSQPAIEVYNYIQDNTAEDETIAFFKPRALYLNTARVSLLPQEKGFRISDADYYLEYKPAEEKLLEAETATDFIRIYENEEFILHQKLN